ncbi:uncharacterized protein PHACADRAFT_187383 [Phanerochaete carnosa HHB-10118-sp]|uniref:Uncharacterized protein n=1 Tax=Phanerochaete carnosa (strain HHB-10118-sp) TaxID=650164 RepID=K5UQB1_PHACS|nr:uncharacterized protein PHACADRAFT_187383 [Phanerochaete carnosa HHB-10118-sp]EKM52011.1 hypothetical protein PHACADRAFT_187383 [Phanerochaete carnosa HHB-10118-sp]
MTASQDKTCKPVATWVNVCRQDFACLVAIAFLVLYVLFGVTPTLNAIKWCHRIITGKPKDLPKDIEDPEPEYEGQDPYHSPTQLLKRFISRYSDARTTVPPTTYLPVLPKTSSPLSYASSRRRSVPLHNNPQDRLRLAQFQFPATRRSSVAPALESVPDLFSPSVRSSRCTTDTDLETLDGLVLGNEGRRKSFLDASDYSALAFVDIDLQEKSPAGSEAMYLPNIPPPAHLDLDWQMEPERFEYNSA